MKQIHFDKKQICIYSMLLIIVGLSVYLYFNTRMPNYGLNKDPYKMINDGYQISYNEKTEVVSLPAKISEATYDAKIERHFEAEELVGNYLCFYAYNPACDIYIDGKQVLHEAKENDVYHLASPSHWYCIEVPVDDFDLTIYMHNSLKISTLFQVYNGSKNALTFHIFRSNIFQTIVSIFVFIIGAGMFVASFFIKGKLTGRLRWLGITFIDCGIWVYSLASVSQLFVDRTVLVSFLGYCTFFMLAPLTLGFVLTYDSFRKMTYMRVLFWVQITATILCFALQFLNMVEWPQLFKVVHVEVVSVVFGILLSLFKNIRSKTREERQVYYALMIISFFLCVDIIRYYVSNSSEGVIKYSIYGIVVLLSYLAYSVIHMITKSSLQEAKNEVYRELAFKDVMTQMENRSSYELKIETLRKLSPGFCAVVVADLNNLKYINDTYGHHYGDDAIIRTATLLRRFFLDIADCYRIGGDEFCIISTSSSADEFSKRFQQFKQAAKEEAELVQYPYSVATGCGEMDHKGIDYCIKSVDFIMYKNKRASKKARD